MYLLTFLRGLEPLTIGLENRCSIQLSYRNMLLLYRVERSMSIDYWVSLKFPPITGSTTFLPGMRRPPTITETK